MNNKQIIELIKSDEWMMEVISIAASLNLKDWAIGAGFVRNKVWDYLSDKHGTGVDTPDIDLVYYDPKGNNEDEDKRLSKKLIKSTGYNWEIVNEFYAYKWNNIPPYKSTEDAISQWPETATAVGVTQDKSGEIAIVAPHGIEDLVNFIVRPTPAFIDKIDILKKRAQNKNWLEKWPRIKIFDK